VSVFKEDQEISGTKSVAFLEGKGGKIPGREKAILHHWIAVISPPLEREQIHFLKSFVLFLRGGRGGAEAYGTLYKV
jgi:hypothetical protein